MTPSRGTPARIFLFVYARTTRNSLRRLVQRLREPRYGIGFVLGVLYFFWIFSRSRFGSPASGAVHAVPSLPPQALSLVLLFASGVFAVILLGSWVTRRGKPDLSLSEAEAQFFFSAPLSSRAVVHYALIRPQAALLISSLVLVLLFRRGPLAGRLQSLLGTWILLSTLRLHWLGIAFARASWKERGRSMREGLVTLAAAGLLALLLFSFLGAATAAFASLVSNGSLSADDLGRAVASRSLAGVSGLLLLPARAVLAPLFATTAAEFVPRFLLAAGILAAHYLWVARAATGYEEATLEGAVRRAERRVRRLAGRAYTAPVSRRRRGILPFALPSLGRPELAIVWKNLISWHRVRLARLGLGVLALCASLFLVSRLVSAAGLSAVAVSAASVVLFVGVMVSIMLPLGPRYDLRQDLENLDVLRAWPLSADRLVAAELATPWLLSVGSLLTGVALSAAILAGTLTRKAPSASEMTGEGIVAIAFPLLLAGLCVVPAVSAFFVLVQNGLTLAFPAWFHQRERRVTSLERSGSMMLSLLLTLLVLALAALPCALVAGLLWLLFQDRLGLWLVPIAAVPSSAILWCGVFLSVKILARLYEGLDVSVDLVT